MAVVRKCDACGREYSLALTEGNGTIESEGYTIPIKAATRTAVSYDPYESDKRFPTDLCRECLGKIIAGKASNG
jgi:hypothetical protein